MAIVKRPLRPEEAEWYAKQGIDPNTIVATQEVPDTKEESSALAAAGRGAASAALPTAAGGYAAGATMAATPALLAAAGFAPLTGGASVAVPLLLGLAAGAGAGALTAKGQEMVIPEEWKQILAKDIEEHPYASRAGQLATLPLGGFSPSRDVFRAGTYGVSKLLGAPTTREGAQAALNVGLGSGLGVVQEGAMQTMRGDFDLGALGESALIGSVFTKRNPLGKAYGFHEPAPFKVDVGNPEFRLGAKQVVSAEKEKVTPTPTTPAVGPAVPTGSPLQGQFNFGPQLLAQPEFKFQGAAEDIIPTRAPRTPAIEQLEASLKNSGYTGAITPEVLAGWAEVMGQHGVELGTSGMLPSGAKGMYEPGSGAVKPKATVDTSRASVTTAPHELSHHMWRSMAEPTRKQLVDRIAPEVERINKERTAWNEANPDKKMRMIDAEEYFASEMGVKAAERAASGENVGFKNWWNDTKAFLTARYGDPSVGDIYRTELVRLMNAQKPVKGGATLVNPEAKKEEYGEGIEGLDTSGFERAEEARIARLNEGKRDLRARQAAEREKIGLETRSAGQAPVSYPEDPFYEANLRAPERRHELGGDEGFFPGEQIPPGEMDQIERWMGNAFKYHVGRVKAYSELKRIQPDDLNNIKTRVWIDLISEGIDKDGLKNSIFRRMNDALNEEITDYKKHRQGKISLQKKVGEGTTELGDILPAKGTEEPVLTEVPLETAPEGKEPSPVELPTTELEVKGKVKQELSAAEQPVKLSRTTLNAIENMQEMREVMVARAEAEMKGMGIVQKASARADLDAKLAKFDDAIKTLKEMPPEAEFDVNKIMKAMSGRKAQEAAEDITPPEGYRWVNLVKEGGEKEKVLFNDKYYKGFPGGDRASYARLNPEGKMSHGVTLPGQKIEEIGGGAKMQPREEDIFDTREYKHLETLRARKDATLKKAIDEIQAFLKENPEYSDKLADAMVRDHIYTTRPEKPGSASVLQLVDHLAESERQGFRAFNTRAILDDMNRQFPLYDLLDMRKEAWRAMREGQLNTDKAEAEESIIEHEKYLREEGYNPKSPAYTERQQEFARKEFPMGREEALLDDAVDFIENNPRARESLLNFYRAKNKSIAEKELHYNIDDLSNEVLAQRMQEILGAYNNTYNKKYLHRDDIRIAETFLDQFPEHVYKEDNRPETLKMFDSSHQEIGDLDLPQLKEEYHMEEQHPITPEMLHDNWETYKSQVKEQNPELFEYLNNIMLAPAVNARNVKENMRRDYVGELKAIEMQRSQHRADVRRRGEEPKFQEGGEDIQTSTPEFQKWFGESKVVDEQGKPLTVYHESGKKDINIFHENTHFGTKEQANEHLMKVGSARGDFDRIVYPAYIKIENPWTGLDVGQSDWHSQIQRAKELGHDGIVYENTREGEGKSYIVFDPKQIKSAIGNRGTFDPENPDIRYSEAGEDIDTGRQGFFNMFSSTFDKLKKAAPQLAKAFRKWEGQKDIYEGWGTLAMKDLQRFNRDEVNEVWEAHRTAFRNKTELPAFTGNKEKISDILTDYFHDSIGEERNALGLTINDRTAGKNPAYVPDMLSPKAVDLLVNKPYLPEGKAAAREWAEYIHKASKGDVSMEEAKEYVKQYTRAMGSTTGNYLSVEYGAIRKAEGYGVPESLREKDAINALSRYSRRAARDLAMFKELETPKKIAAALELADRTTGATIKHEGVEGISKLPEVKDAMKWVTGEFASSQSALQSPKSTAIVRLVNNLIMGPATALRDTATVPLNMVPYLNKFSDLGAALSGISKLRENARQSMEYGATKPNIDKIEFQDLAQSPDKFTDFFRKAATLARLLQGREHIENFNRDLTFSIGKELARSHILGAKAGKKYSQDFLKKFGELVDGDITKLEGTKLEDALAKIGKTFTDRNQGTYGGRGLPVWMLDSQFAPFFSLQKWSLEKSNVIWQDVIKPFISGENRLPMLTYALGSVMTGAGIQELNQLLTNKKSQDPDWKEVEAAGGPKDYVAKLVSLMQLGSYAGIISDIAKGATDAAVYGKTPRNLVSFPTASLALDLQEKIAFASEAIAQGDNSFDVISRVAMDIMSQNVQAARMLANRTWKADEIERSGKFRDLRVYEQLRGGAMNRFPKTNPYLDLESRVFKRTSDPAEAREKARELVKTARAESENRYEFKQRMKSAKTMSYRTVPNRETDPIGYRRYYRYLIQTQGKEAADAIIADNRRQRRLNARKAKMLP